MDVLKTRIFAARYAKEIHYEEVTIFKGAEVIPPFLAGCMRRIHAAIFSFWAGVMPPMPMLGRSLL